MKQKIDLYKEINKIKDHRKLYEPIIRELLSLYDSKDKKKWPLKFEDFEKIKILTELIDIGYLDQNTVIIKRNFGKISHIIFTGDYPLTPLGKNLLKKLNLNNKRSVAISIIFILFIILFFLIIINYSK